MPYLTHPLALWGLLALPALAAIYLLRNRYRRKPVSSLMLWLDPREARTGGPRIDRLQTPLLFFLECLLLVLLVLAASGPHLPLAQGGRPLVIILDDSFSMRASDPDSPRAAALKDLEDELKRGGRSRFRLVLAGERPTLLGESAESAVEVLRLLEGWRCQAPRSSLPAAISLAGEVGGELAALLVVTDHKPEKAIEKGRLQWRAFGKPRDNLAIVTAARTFRDGADRLLLEVANLSEEVRSTTLVVDRVQPAAVLHQTKLTLEKDAIHRVVLQLKEDTGLVRARIDEDALTIDNMVTLLPAPSRIVAVQLALSDSTLRKQTEKALQATRATRMVPANPAVLITDAVEVPELSGETWALQMLSGTEQVAYDGPFVIDRGHPLADGLSLQGVIWAPGSKAELPGRGLILAGNVPLLTDSEDAAGRHLLRLRLRHNLSSLLESPSWLVLLSNLLDWRGSVMPGLSRSNIRLGEETTLTLARTSDDVTVATPDGNSRRLSVQEGRVVMRGEQTGLIEIRHGKEKTRFAVNALNRDESDLRKCASGVWGDWLDETALRLEYQDIGWLLLLVALAIGVLHLLVMTRVRPANAGTPSAQSAQSAPGRLS
jgi:hypothetical protein